MKRYTVLLASALFCVVCFSLYLMLETASEGGGYGELAVQDDLDSIERKIKQIEVDLQHNHRTINLIKEAVRDMGHGNSNSLLKLQAALQAEQSASFLRPKLVVNSPSSKPVSNSQFNLSLLKKPVVRVPVETCSISRRAPKKPDVQMQDVFDQLSFNNPDGGVWKQGFPITYNDMQWKPDDKLNIFVVPHSHCDPGWLKTVERYYNDQTKHILNNMVDKLEQYPKMRFIYAEMSFFYMWWNEIGPDKKKRVKNLLSDGRLELVTAGWVMTDEANAHYYSMLDQLIEGNTWLYNELGIRPRSGWAIDPFGHSPTMPYLLRRSGFHGMLIQRVHYSVKKYLAQHKNLEFNWRQTWDDGQDTDMFCHMMPFYSYDVPHTCGPEPKTCCQFDFKRLPGNRVTCPWKIPPQPINDGNVATK